MKCLLIAWMLLLPFTSQAVAGRNDADASRHFYAPAPLFPYKAKSERIQGVGAVRVEFDASGRVVRATMARSTGSVLLDNNTVGFARLNWHCDKGRPATKLFPVAYLLR